MQDWLKKAEAIGEDRIAQYTEGFTFPATKEQIVAQAQKNNLPKEVIDRLAKLPDKSYNGIADLITTTVKEAA